MTSYTLPDTAEAIMTPSPISIKAFNTVHEAVILMTEHKVSALPVVNDKDQPIGVLSQKDIIRYDRERSEYPVFYQQVDLADAYSAFDDSHIENADVTKTEEIMTPIVFSVNPKTSLTEVIKVLTQQKVHRLFVVDKNEKLAGVVSGFDILKHLAHTD